MDYRNSYTTNLFTDNRIILVVNVGRVGIQTADYQNNGRGMPTRPIFITAILDIESRFRDEVVHFLSPIHLTMSLIKHIFELCSHLAPVLFLIRLTHEQYSRNFLKKIIRIMI
jgi:hypothetical protein